MMLSAAVLLLMVAMVASDSNDMTKSEVTLKTDTKSILDLLVKLMNAEREEREKTELVKQDDDTATSNQGTVGVLFMTNLCTCGSSHL